MRGEWPAGANTGRPTKPIHTCICGAQSSSPINHDHSVQSKEGS